MYRLRNERQSKERWKMDEKINKWLAAQKLGRDNKALKYGDKSGVGRMSDEMIKEVRRGMRDEY